jgi:hypothetical protein
MQVTNNVCPGIDKLVNVLYTDEINEYIEEICKDELDKKTFIMFVIMYFYAYFNVEGKNNIKLVLSNIMRDPDKRSKCVQCFVLFQKSLNNPNLAQVEEGVKTLLN